jgi:hypothetical protein
MKSGKRRGTLRQELDPIIIGRRAVAAPLWLTHKDGATVLSAVNEWLREQGELPVTIHTIYLDHRAIKEQWLRDGAKIVEVARIMHIMALRSLMQRQWEDYMQARERGRNVAHLSDNIRKTIMSIAAVDGTLSPVRVTVSEDARARLAEALAAPPQVDAKAIDLLPDGLDAPSVKRFG